LFDYDGQNILEKKFTWINDHKTVGPSNYVSAKNIVLDNKKSKVKKTVSIEEPVENQNINNHPRKFVESMISRKRNRLGNLLNLNKTNRELAAAEDENTSRSFNSGDKNYKDDDAIKDSLSFV
jgi:hypothetical protein